MDTLSALDATFLHVETERSQMHVGSVALFEGPPPPIADLVAAIEGKLPVVPRYRQKVRFVPLRVGRPVWVDDPRFEISRHVRRRTLAPPGGEPDLLALAGRIMSPTLDRSRPLWEMWLVEGLDGHRWSLVNKVHHAMVDGVSGMDLMAAMFDPTPAARPHGPPATTWRPEPEPSAAAIATRALARQPADLARAAVGGIRHPRRALGGLATAVRGAGVFAPLLRPHRSGLTGPVGRRRRFTVARASLAEVKLVRRAFGATVNDVVLAAVSRGFRDLLASRDEPLPGRTVRTMVPVSVRSAEERGSYNNRVTTVFAELPVGLADPVERLASVRAEMEAFKASGRAVAADTLIGMAGFAPALLLDLAGRLGARTPVAAVDTVTTNIPGPQVPLYLLGRRMLEVFPFVPIAARVRITVGIFSYDGRLTFGINSDLDTVPDVGVLADGIEAGVRELVEAAGSA